MADVKIPLIYVQWQIFCQRFTLELVWNKWKNRKKEKTAGRLRGFYVCFGAVSDMDLCWLQLLVSIKEENIASLHQDLKPRRKLFDTRKDIRALKHLGFTLFLESRGEERRGVLGCCCLSLSLSSNLVEGHITWTALTPGHSTQLICKWEHYPVTGWYGGLSKEMFNQPSFRKKPKKD